MWINFKNLTIENNEVFLIQKPEPYILKCTGEIGNYALSVLLNALCSLIIQLLHWNKYELLESAFAVN